MEKSYYFSKNELVLLLGTGNVTEIYGFQMPSENEFDDNAFTMALYQLVKRGCIEMGSEPKLSAEMLVSGTDWCGGYGIAGAQ